MRSFCLFFSFIFSASFVLGQPSSVYGKITDGESGEEILYANIVLNKNGVKISGGSTDFEGNYSIPVDSGIYNLKITYLGYLDHIVTDVIVNGGSSSKLDIQLNKGINGDSLFSFVCGPPLIGGKKTQQKELHKNTSVYGIVTDEETGEELLYANIILNKNGVFVTGGSTDFEGNYSIPADPGIYELKISYTGYPDRVITDVIVNSQQGTKLDLSMKQGLDIEIITWRCGGRNIIPLINHKNTSTGEIIIGEQIQQQAHKDIPQLIQNTAGVSINNF